MRWLPRGRPTGASAMRWDWMRSSHPVAAQILDAMSQDSGIADYDYARILAAVDQASARSSVADALSDELVRSGPGAALHPSGLRTLPGTRLATHNMLTGQVRLGRIVTTDGLPPDPPAAFDADLDTLRTSLLAVGPPRSGKTRGIAMPIVEHLSMTALTHGASLVVVDSQAQFDRDGWFDVTIDPLNPTHGISLFGGAAPDIAADRLASALLPPRSGDDTAFVDAAANALYGCLAPYVEGFGSWPTVRELLALLRAERSATDAVRERLQGPDANQWRDLLDSRKAQVEGNDPATGLVERVARLDRPALRRIFDADTTFDMRDINGPVRVRVVLPETDYPDAARILARLVVSQFVQIATSAGADRRVFKALVVDGAGGCVDSYVANSVRRLRPNNAGLMLFARSMSDFEADVGATISRAVGSKAVFGGVDPADARMFAQWFGDDVEAAGDDPQPRPDADDDSDERPRVVGPFGARRRPAPKRPTTRTGPARWTSSDIAGVPNGHCVIALMRSNGFRTGPVLVNLQD
ncbi:MAG: hypothetical protein ACRDO7_10160 [Nocardioidaceae bacterium]